MGGQPTDGYGEVWLVNGRSRTMGGPRLLAILAALVLFVAACGSSDGEAAQAPTTAAAAPTATQAPQPTPEPTTEPTVVEPDAPATAPPEAADSETDEADETEADSQETADEPDAADAPAATSNPALAALGVTEANPPIADPPGGQSGADSRDWTVDPRADITEYGAALVAMPPELAQQLFANTSFPCGAAAAYVVTCPPGVTAFGDDKAVIVFMRLAAPVEPGGGSLQYGLAFDADGDSSNNYFGQAPFELDMFNDTEHWYRLQIDADGNRHVWVDGIRDGVPGFPRHSSAVVIEWGDTIVWIIPRSELPGEVLEYRVTTFFNTRSPEQMPTPDAAGGDVSGLDVSTLERIPDEMLAAELGPDVPPDVEGTVERLPGPVEDPDLALARASAQVFEHRLNEAFATGETEPVRQLMHFLSKVNSPDGCLATVQRSFPNAQRIVLSDVSGPEPNEFLVVYRATATVSYPTGDSSFPALLAPDVDGRLSLFTDCSQG